MAFNSAGEFYLVAIGRGIYPNIKSTNYALYKSLILKF